MKPGRLKEAKELNKLNKLHELHEETVLENFLEGSGGGLYFGRGEFELNDTAAPCDGPPGPD